MLCKAQTCLARFPIFRPFRHGGNDNEGQQPRLTASQVSAIPVPIDTSGRQDLSETTTVADS